MVKPEAAHIFIRKNGILCDFMWANLMDDGSAMLGFSNVGPETFLGLRDADGTEVGPKECFTKPSGPAPKITFHASGLYKHSCEIGRTPSSVDRLTTEGEPLSQITAPRCMMEILLPQRLCSTQRQVGPLDIVLELGGFPNRPARCNVFCMGLREFKQLDEKHPPKFVGTSEIEFSRVLVTQTHAWIWVLRVSQNDVIGPSDLMYCVPGRPRWPK
ncbi:MAG: hypothetical protein AB1696_11880 [Planctomycetota bacterium]